MAAEVILRVKVDRSQYNAFKEEVKKGIDTGGQNATADSLKKVGDQAQASTSKIQSLGEMLTKKIAWYSISMAISSVTTAFKDALTEIKEVDTQLTNIAKVSNASAEQLQALSEKAYSTASKYGVEASKYMEAVYEYTKAGFQDNADVMAELSTKAMLVGDTTASIADKFLIAGNAAWNYGKNVEELSLLVDKADYINNNYATTFDKIAEGFPRVASVASLAGMSAEETMAALGTITSTTQETASRASTALRALIINILGDTTTEIEDGVTATVESIEGLQDALRKYAPDVIAAAEATGSLIDPMESLKALSEAYKRGDLTESGLFEIESALGGKLRTNQLDALLKNFDMYEEMLQGMASAAGTADKEIDVMLTSWEAKSQILKNTWTEFISEGLNADMFKGVIDGATDLLDRFGGLNEVLPIVGGAMTALFAPAIVGNIQKISENFANLKTAFSGGFRTLDAETNTIKTNWGAIGTAVSLGVTAITTAYALYENYVRKIRQNSEKETEEAVKTAETSRSQAENILELYASYKSAEEGTKEYTTATEALCTALGIEKDAVADVQEAIESLTETQLKKALDDTNAAVEKAKINLLTIPETLDGANGNLILAAGRTYDVVANERTGLAATRTVSDEERLRRMVQQYREYSAELKALEAAYSAESYGDLQAGWMSGSFDSGTKVRANEYLNTMSKEEIRKQINTLSGYISEASFVQTYLDQLKAQAEYQKAYNDYINGEIDYDELADAANDYANAEKNASDEASKLAEKQQAVADAFSNIKGQATAATEALEKYQQAIEGDTTEDAMKGYVEAFQAGFEDYQKGMKDSAKIRGLAELVFSDEQISEIKKRGDSLADAVFQNPLLKRIFISGYETNEETGETTPVFREELDAAKEFASWVKEFDTDKNGLITRVVGDTSEVAATLLDTDEGLKIIVQDWELLSEQTGIDIGLLQALMGEYGLLFEGYEASGKDLLAVAEQIGALTETGKVDVSKIIVNRAVAGETKEEISRLTDSLVEAAERGELDLNIDYDTAEQARAKIEEIIDEALELAGQEYEVDITADDKASAILDKISEKIRNLPSEHRIDIIAQETTYKSTVDHGYNEMRTSASGTNYAFGGATLVNEEGAEIIQANGMAWVAGGGKPTITNLPRGAKVWNAKETKAILGNSDLSALYKGIGSYASGTNVPSAISSVARTTAWENARFGADTSDDEQLKNLQNMVSLRKAELQLIEESDGSLEDQIKKQRGIQAAIVDVVTHLQEIGGKQEDITQLAAEWYQIEGNISDLQEEKGEQLTKQQQEHLEELEDETDLLKSQLDLIEAKGGSTADQIKKQREIRKSVIQQAKYLKEIGGSETEINKLLTERYEIDKTIKNLRAEERKVAKEEVENRRQKHLQKLQDKTSYLESQLSLIEERDGSIKNQIRKERQIEKSLQKQIDYMRKIGGSNEEINQLKLKQLQIDKEIAAKEQQLYTNLQEAIQRRMEDINTKRDEELAKVDEQIEKLREEHDLQAEKNELKEKELELEKAQDAYENAKRQRTVRVYNAEKGQWEWTYDETKVSSAREAYESAQKSLSDYLSEQEFEAEIEKLENKQQKITDKYDKLLDQWQTVLDAMEKPLQTIKSAINALSNNATKDMSPTIAKINAALSAMGKPTINTANLYDSGGVLNGIGGIKGTAADEIILPPDITKQMLKPAMTSQLSRRMEELRYVYGATGNLAGMNSMAIGSQHNGDIYTFGNITLNKEQAKSTTVYDLARMASGLRSYSSAM